METEKLPEVRLECLDEKSAQWVIDRCNEAPKAGRNNRGRREGKTVIITYADFRWPYDIAEMAEAEGMAADAEIAAVYACL